MGLKTSCEGCHGAFAGLRRSNKDLMRKNIWILLFAMAYGSHVLAQVHKCTVNGKIVYQQPVCDPTNGGTGAEVMIRNTKSSDAGSLSELLYPESERKKLDALAKNVRDAQIEVDRLTMEHCKDKSFTDPALGMDEADLRCIKRFRNPVKINVTEVVGIKSKQYVFTDHDRTAYIYFKNGVLSSMQNTSNILDK